MNLDFYFFVQIASEEGTNNESSTNSSGRAPSGNSSSTLKEQSSSSGNHRHRHHIRVRQSHSLNRISELHAEDFFLGCDADDSSGLRQLVEPNGRVNGSVQRQLSSESDSDGTTCDMLSRYLESLSANNRNGGSSTTRSRDDSLNSSDGEFEGGLSGHEQQPRPPRRHKVNLLSLEQRLNKIQVRKNLIANLQILIENCFLVIQYEESSPL